MSLSRRLYRIEEVRAALFLSLKQRRWEETFFWLNELEESGFTNYSRRLLLMAWCLFVGVKWMGWLTEWARVSTTREGRQILAAHLLRCSDRDSTLAQFLFAGIVKPKNCNDQEQKWIQSCKQDNEEFWSSLLDMTEDADRIEILENLQEDTQTAQVFARIAGFAVCHLKHGSQSWKPARQLSADTIPKEMLSKLETLPLPEQRLFPIPYDCLFGMTIRGMGADTTEELRELSLSNLRTSSYWWSRVRKYLNDDLEWRDDSAKEEFQDTEFPPNVQDCPDEWSLKFQQMSHGAGTTCVETATLERWWRLWIVPQREQVSESASKEILQYMSSIVGGHPNVLDMLRTALHKKPWGCQEEKESTLFESSSKDRTRYPSP